MQATPEADKKAGNIFDKKAFARLFSYTRPYRKWFFLGVFFTILTALVAPVRPIMYQYIIDNFVVRLDIKGVRLFVFLTFLILIFETILAYTNTILTNWLGQSIIRDMRNQVFRHILHLRSAFYDKTPIGQLQTRTISDVESINEVFTSGFVKIAGDLLQLIVIFGIMLYLNWELTLVVCLTVPLMIVSTRIFQKKIKSSFQSVRKEVAAMNSFLQEHITGMSIVQVFNREKTELKRFNDINNKLLKANVDSVLYYSIFFPVIELIISLALALIVWYGAGSVIKEKMLFGEVVAFISLIQMFFRPIRMLADQINTLQLGMVSAERVFKLIDTDEYIPQTGTDKPEILDNELFTIEFKSVWFAYNEPDWILKGVSFKVTQGEKVAFVGATGSGKSTIISLLGRFYEIQKGEILLNGKDIRQYSLPDLRKLMGVVLQDVFLFSGTVAENITLNNPDIPLRKVEEAARHVGADGFIQQLPGKYDYIVQERGATLSLGQRQLISFARVWIYNPMILILDEATANIDTESEQVIQRAIDTIMAGRTCFIIAHRLSTIQKADKIIVLEKGEIIESGTHQSLLEQQGKYYQLSQIQFAANPLNEKVKV
ncbi:MAG: ABC transporter ATP-binding protein/permease [Bacteroidia bacterium]|nr:ABC transporter ATP-binding protein/permease [Bacteroidia bacterium]